MNLPDSGLILKYFISTLDDIQFDYLIFFKDSSQASVSIRRPSNCISNPDQWNRNIIVNSLKQRYAFSCSETVYALLVVKQFMHC